MKKSESAAKQTAGRAKSASKKAKSGASEAAEEVQDTDLGAKAQGAVDSVQARKFRLQPHTKMEDL